MTHLRQSRHHSPPSAHPQVSKIGETGETVVYIFPGGHACVKKGKTRKQTKLRQSPPSQTSSPASRPASSHQASPLSPVERSGRTPVMSQDLGDRLVAAGIISAMQLQVARYDQRSMNIDLGDVLLARGWITQDGLSSFQSA